MRIRFGTTTVLSGYRHRNYNAGIGGAKYSQHIYDDSPASVAADLRFAKDTPAEWAAFARRLGVGGVGRLAGGEGLSEAFVLWVGEHGHVKSRASRS